MEYEYDALLSLVGAVYVQAIKDAKRGQSGAIWFLEHTFPEWRRIGSARQGDCRYIGQIGQVDNKQRNGGRPVRSPLEKEITMDTELDRMNQRNAKMEELRAVKTTISDFGTEITGIKHDHAALVRWRDLGGSEATFARINGRHFAGMTEAAQVLLVKEMESGNNG